MTKSLQGIRILNTRPLDQASSLSKDIINAGGIAIECPALAIKATNPSWISLVPDLRSVHCAIFISPNAVHYAIPILKQNNIVWPEDLQVIAIGQATARALGEHHINTTRLPQISDSEHLLKLAELQNINNKTVLLFKGEGGRKVVEQGLTIGGAKVVNIMVYRRELPEHPKQLIESIWRNDLVDIILATSEQSLHNLFVMFGSEGKAWLQSKDYLVLSERLAKYAASLGIRKIKISLPEEIINALFDYVED